jgi:hypothetical protein
MLLTECACYLGVVRQLWESEGTITSPKKKLVTEEGKCTKYEIKRFEVDIGVLLLIGRLGVSPHPKAYTLQTDEISTFKTSETGRIYIKVLSAQR